MPVVSVINYKGGVGKTTLTANLGAELARRGHKVLLVDLDPQASLTFSFYDAEVWEKELADRFTILQWFGSLLDQPAPYPLRRYVVAPPVVNQHVQAGRLDLLASHLDLLDVDLEFAHRLGGSRSLHRSPDFLRLHRAMRDALRGADFAEYAVVLLDCPPNFSMVTRVAIAASDHLLVPAKPDYLSTLGIGYLRGRLSGFVTDYNRAVSTPAEEINPTMLGVVFTMVQYAGGNPIQAMRGYLDVPETLEVAQFAQKIRDNKTVFGRAGEHGIPAVLMDKNDLVQFELEQLASEFYAKIRI